MTEASNVFDNKNLLSKLRLGIKVSNFGLGEVDYVADTIILNGRAAEIFDLPANSPMSRDKLHERIHPGDWPIVEGMVKQLLSPNGDDFIDIEHRVVHSDGSILWVNARKQIEFRIDQQSGQLVPHNGLVALLDVTKSKSHEAHIQFLMDEVSHRSRNLMTIVQTIARMSAKNDDEHDFADRLVDRIQALSHNQDDLTQDRKRPFSLKDLVTFHLRPFLEADSKRLIVDGPSVNFKADVAQAIGLALHELATNAAKYGALSTDEGTLSVTWSISDEPTPEFTMTWVECGGPSVVSPTRQGFGQKVVKGMAASAVNGTAKLDYDPAGLRWQLRAALSDVVKG